MRYDGIGVAGGCSSQTGEDRRFSLFEIGDVGRYIIGVDADVLDQRPGKVLYSECI